MEKENKGTIKKALKVLLCIILVIIIILGTIIIKKAVVLSNLRNRFNEQMNRKNYHLTAIAYTVDSYTKTNIYYLEGKRSIDNEEYSNGKVTKSKRFEYENYFNYYEEKDGEKTAELNNTYKRDEEFKLLEDNDLWTRLTLAAKTSISTKECNGKECYYITSIPNNNTQGIYVEKATGLTIRECSKSETSSEINSDLGNNKIGSIRDYIYEFDVVAENAFNEPDISEYTVISE